MTTSASSDAFCPGGLLVGGGLQPKAAWLPSLVCERGCGFYIFFDVFCYFGVALLFSNIAVETAIRLRPRDITGPRARLPLVLWFTYS